MVNPKCYRGLKGILINKKSTVDVNELTGITYLKAFNILIISMYVSMRVSIRIYVFSDLSF